MDHPHPGEPYAARGDRALLIDNNLYGQYAGEVQIARKPMKNYGKTNVVGHIDPREVELLPYMKGSTPFGFNF